jgi:hypothetical protein
MGFIDDQRGVEFLREVRQFLQRRKIAVHAVNALDGDP